MPYKKVVVPLDGSKLAELALPHLEEIASGCHISEIELITVTQKTKGQTVDSESTDRTTIEEDRSFDPTAMGGYTGIIYRNNSAPKLKVPVTLGKMAKAGREYLYKIAEQLEKKGLKVTTSVLIGDVAEEVVRFADDQDADLIIMASQGKTALRTWDVGKAAFKVFRASSIPVLLVKPPANFKETKPKRKGSTG